MAVVTFYVLVAGHYFQAKADPDLNLSHLLFHLQSPEFKPHPRVSALAYLRCNYYLLKNPLELGDDNLPDVDKITSSLQDEDKYRKVSFMKKLGRVADEFKPDFLYIVIEDSASDNPPAALARLSENHSDLFCLLTVEVKSPKKWTKADVTLNGGIFATSTTKPLEIKDLETRLQRKRSFSDDVADEELSLMCGRFNEQFTSTYTKNHPGEGQGTVEDAKEFIAFYDSLRCYLPDAARYKAASSSSLKANALKANFTLPAFFRGRQSGEYLAYHEEMPWKFPLFIRCPTLSNFPRKYVPCPDWSVWFAPLALPLVIAEVSSDSKEMARFHMLVQGVALARLVFHIRKPSSTAKPFIIATYLTKDMIAERYIIMKTEHGDDSEVHISREDYDLTKEEDAIKFQREMFNLASEITSVFEELDCSKRGMLLAILKDASGLASLHTSGAWDKQTPAHIFRTIAEEQCSSSENEDDLGIFGGNGVSSVLKEMGHEVAYVVSGRSNMAPIVRLSNGEASGCLKFVADGERAKEIEILEYLVGLDDESNHTVRPMRIWKIAQGWIIAMPLAGEHPTQLSNLDTHLWSLVKQLFEAIMFMHDHNVAHLDLKPSNILVPKDCGRLTIIDFGVSVRLRNATQLLRGRAGTEGYIAPEVDGATKFSPIRADLWSAGKVVEELCLHCHPSRPRDALLALSRRLLDEDSGKRPMMSEALQWMLNYDANTAV